MGGRTGKTPRQISHKKLGIPSPAWLGWGLSVRKTQIQLFHGAGLAMGQIPTFPQALISLGISLRIPPSSTSAPTNPSQRFIPNSLARAHSSPLLPSHEGLSRPWEFHSWGSPASFPPQFCKFQKTPIFQVLRKDTDVHQWIHTRGRGRF